MVIGLSGNIGCGKSTLSNLLIQNGIEVIDLDIISREVMNDKIVLDKVFDTFGKHLKLECGSLDRKELGKVVFNNEEKLKLLNSILHPVIKENVVEKINDINLKKKCKAIKEEKKIIDFDEEIIEKKEFENIIMIDGALLIEANFLDLVDKLLLITCNESIQLERVIKRDNCTQYEAIKRINSQMNQEKKKKYADYIIDNSFDVESLNENLDEFLCFIKENWGV